LLLDDEIEYQNGILSIHSKTLSKEQLNKIKQFDEDINEIRATNLTDLS
jgi:hypothetical protein